MGSASTPATDQSKPFDWHGEYAHSLGGTWFVILRLYRPRPSVIDATWECPPIRSVG
jgi:hypothetical protein